MTVYGKRTEPAYTDFDAPLSYARNDHVLVWWLPAYDEILRNLVEQWAWGWPWEATSSLAKAIPPQVIEAWKRSDPLCSQYAHYNVLMYFAIARAKELGLVPRKARWKVCPVCNERFIESSLPMPILKRVGLNAIDCCSPCYERALLSRGSNVRSADQITATLQALMTALQREVKASDLQGPRNLPELDPRIRIAAIRALADKPSPERVRAVFGSWDAAIKAASGELPATPIVEPTVLPAKQPVPTPPPAPSRDWIALWTSRPNRPSNSEANHLEEFDRQLDDIRLLMGSGEIKLARDLLYEVCSKPEPSPWACETLAEMLAAEGNLPSAIDMLTQYTKYIRSSRPYTWRDEIRAVEDVIGRLREGESMRPWLHWAVPPEGNNDGSFWLPRPNLPKGNVVFVMIGGPMYFTDLRGEHACFSGQNVDGDAAVELAESVARLNSLVESKAWIQTAVSTANRIQRLAQRSYAKDAWVYSIGYVTGWFRDIVKDVIGRPPTKVRKDGLLDRPVSSRWLYDRDPLQFVAQSIRSNGVMDIRATPSVALWRYPDRSDQSIQAFCDTLTGDGSVPLVVLLPDVPACRDFARRYNGRQRMTRVARTFIEDVTVFAQPPSDRGHECYGRYDPTLLLMPDSTEIDGDYLSLALEYLERNYQLRLSPWDLIQDPLMRTHLDDGLPALRAKRESERPWTEEEAHARVEDASRYARDAENMMTSWLDRLLREYVPQAITDRYGQP